MSRTRNAWMLPALGPNLRGVCLCVCVGGGENQRRSQNGQRRRLAERSVWGVPGRMLTSSCITAALESFLGLGREVPLNIQELWRGVGGGAGAEGKEVADCVNVASSLFCIFYSLRPWMGLI